MNVAYYVQRTETLLTEFGSDLAFQGGFTTLGVIDRDAPGTPSTPTEGLEDATTTATVFTLKGADYAHFLTPAGTLKTGQEFTHEGRAFRVREVEPVSFANTLIQCRLFADRV